MHKYSVKSKICCKFPACIRPIVLRVDYFSSQFYGGNGNLQLLTGSQSRHCAMRANFCFSVIPSISGIESA